LRLAAEEHVLLLTMHHMISDGWSHGLFWRDLAVLYEAFDTCKPTPLPALPIQYADFACWQRQWLRGEALETQLTYWKQQLAGLATLHLPTDYPRPAVQTFRGARHPMVLSQSLVEALKVLSQRHGVTLFMTLLAVFQALLHRYTGQDDIPVGSLIANRNRVEIEELIGFFVNTLVLRTDLSGNPSFRDLLGRVRAVCLGAYAHQDLPFEKLLEELRPQRELSRNPLFQVLFALHNTPRQAPELLGLSVSSLEVDPGTARFDLALDLWETPEGLHGWFEYSTGLFDAATIARIEGHLQTLLEGIVAAPQQRLSMLPLLTADERHRLLVEWNTTGIDSPHDQCIHQIFEAQVAQTPDAVAVVCEGELLTYCELNRRANQVAHYLGTLGVGPEVLVGLCMERSLEMIVGLLGILKAGGAYVPLDPAYPQERLAFMLEDAQVAVLLTQEQLSGELPEHRAHTICLDTDWKTIAGKSEANPVSGVTADNLAYVIYTSGSTGSPKGVQILHRAVVNFFNSMSQQPGLTAQDILLAVTSVSFDIAALELYLPLIVGACLVVVSRDVAMDGAQLMKKLANSGATVMQATPATWSLLLEAGWQDSKHLKILCGGEALPCELAVQLLARGSSLWNMYGPTETTIWSAVYPVDLQERSIHIGRPIANTQVYVLDRHLQPIPIGVPGELYVGGVGLARGYLHRPELTAERFIPNPFSTEPGARLYKTGDLVRYLPDGNLEFLGRLDDQIKLRGCRIELGEIEAVLGQHPAVRQVVVLAREDAPGDTRLVAYVVPQQEPPPTSSVLRNFLQQRLPSFMVPSAFVLVHALPLTPNGKLDRRALPAPAQTRSQPQDTCMAPQDALELQLTKIWEKVLGITPIGVRENFFELGGHSLLAVRLFAQIKKAFGRQLPLATLFQAPTVEQLAGMLRQEGWSAPWSCLVAIQPGGSKPPFFCIHGPGGHVFS
jgi:amino acid adenylation domain-containing protein